MIELNGTLKVELQLKCYSFSTKNYLYFLFSYVIYNMLYSRLVNNKHISQAHSK